MEKKRRAMNVMEKKGWEVESEFAGTSHGLPCACTAMAVSTQNVIDYRFSGLRTNIFIYGPAGWVLLSQSLN